jgi:SAM-dependent methyltransferase
MTLPSSPNVYEAIGHGYNKRRTPDPRIALKIRAAIGDVRTLVNVGAGSGAYEPTDLEITAVEPSTVMIAQRRGLATVVQARAEELPFDDNQFDCSMAILSVHHWQDAERGLSEMKRVSRRQVVFTFDPALQGLLWLVSDYVPEIVEFEKLRAMTVPDIASCLNTTNVQSVPIPHDCTDGFQAAYWRRPAEYLNADVQSTISTLAQLPREVIDRAIRRLETELASGDWHRKYSHLLGLDEVDFGYRLIIGG